MNPPLPIVFDVCGCGAVKQPDGSWTLSLAPDTARNNGAMCPTCVEKYRSKLSALGKSFSGQRRAVPTGGFKL